MANNLKAVVEKFVKKDATFVELKAALKEDEVLNFSSLSSTDVFRARIIAARIESGGISATIDGWVVERISDYTNSVPTAYRARHDDGRFGPTVYATFCGAAAAKWYAERMRKYGEIDIYPDSFPSVPAERERCVVQQAMYIAIRRKDFAERDRLIAVLNDPTKGAIQREMSREARMVL
jgi:hypothetical protein